MVWIYENKTNTHIYEESSQKKKVCNYTGKGIPKQLTNVIWDTRLVNSTKDMVIDRDDR